MFLEILLAILLGVNARVITGLTPGIHVNLVSALLISSTSFIGKYFGVVSMSCFIVSMATTHTFLDTIPSVFLGAPEAGTALGVLPGHRYLLKGQGLMAVKLTIIGSLASIILAGLLFPLLLPIVKVVYPHIQKIIGIILILVAGFMVLRDKNKFWAIIIFLLSGTLGLIVLNIPNLKNPLFPMLSGLFGTATLIFSLFEKSSIPKQKDLPYTNIDVKKSLKATASGTFSGLITAILPGVGSATAAVMSMQITRKIGDHGFMILIGGISTANFVFSLVTLQALGKARNGALVAVKTLIENVELSQILIFLFVAIFSGGIAAAIALYVSKIFTKLISKIDYEKTLITVITLITILTMILSKGTGIIILITSTAIGLIPAIKKTSRAIAMSCILIPVITYFLF